MQMDKKMSLDEKFVFIKIHYGEPIHDGTVELFKEKKLLPNHENIKKILLHIAIFSALYCYLVVERT